MSDSKPLSDYSELEENEIVTSESPDEMPVEF